ncbi:MAG TPA: YetF domain-containing protein [Chitinophagaceae bacterium]|nr:YetF domain-containing protein [Chitinophagaceae bacterium]
MFLLQAKNAFHWRSLLLGEEEWNFLPEVLFRGTIMFIVTIVALRLIGKRGIMQGVFELVTIITLGSAAGDPMFYKKVGLLPAILVFVTIVLMYKITNYFVARYKLFEHVIEGRHSRLVKECRFVVENFKPHELSKDEILSDLRMKGISHLGQVESAYIEASGQISVFFLPDEKVTYGLPVTPELFEAQKNEIKEKGIYSCGFCGYTEEIAPVKKHTCIICKKTEWVKSINGIRVK